MIYTPYDESKKPATEWISQWPDQKEYRLLDGNREEYRSAEKGKVGGHKGLRIYGRMDCPSALRHLAKGQYRAHRVFFADEQTAVRAGYRPCGICMKGQYVVYKENGETTDFFPVRATIPEDSVDALVCVVLKNGKERVLRVAETGDSELTEYLRQGVIEAIGVRLDGPYCIVSLRAHSDQWGRTIVWQPGSRDIVHLSNTPFARTSAIVNDKLVTLYLVWYWGKPAEPMYSIQPLSKRDLSSEAALISLPLDAPETWDDAKSMQIEQGARGVTFIVDGAAHRVDVT